MISPTRIRKEKAFKFIATVATWTSVLILIVLLTHILSEGWRWLDWQFMDSFPSRFPEKAGLKAGIFGSIWLMALTASISIPIGVFAGLFLEEYGIKGIIGKIIEVNMANLAGVPSIVYGLLGLTVFVRYFGFDRSLLSGALTLSLLIMPVIVVATRESIRAVPNSIRFGAYAMGARKHHVVFGQVLPVALPGIMTGVILALSRAIGETAPLIIVGAVSYISFIPEGIMDEFTVMPLQIYNWAGRPQADFHQLAAAGIIVLVSVMLVMNFVAVLIRHKMQKRYRF